MFRRSKFEVQVKLKSSIWVYYVEDACQICRWKCSIGNLEFGGHQRGTGWRYKFVSQQNEDDI